MFVDEGGNNGNSNDVASISDDLCDFLVFESHYVLPIDLQQLVLRQKSVAGRRRVHDQLDDFPVFKGEPDFALAILMQGHGALQRSKNTIYYVITTKSRIFTLDYNLFQGIEEILQLTVLL